MSEKAKPEHAPSEHGDLPTKIVDFGREVLAPSPHTPRTNLARWGQGCRPYAVASDSKGVLSNIARFAQEVGKSSPLQKRLAYARSWYAYRDEAGHWRFGPSKFVGYDGMTAGGYIDTAEDRDGRRTEAQLQQWFTAVDPASELGAQLSSALYEFLARYGKVPSTKMRINIPNEIHEAHFPATKADDPHDILVATLIAAANALPPSHLEKLRVSLFGR